MNNIWGVGLAFLAGASVYGAKPELSIKDALNVAFDKNPDVREFREKVSEADALKRDAWSHLFPTINATGLASTKKDAVNLSGTAAFNGQSYNYYNAGLTLTQPLFHGGAFSSGISAANREKDIRTSDLQVSERDLTLKVMQAFYSVLLNQRKIDNLVNDDRINEDIVKTIRERHRIGRSISLELLQAKTRKALLVPKIERSKSDLMISAVQLATVMGQPDSQEVHIKGKLEIPLNAVVADMLRKPLGTRPELAKLEQQRDQLDSKKTVALAPHWPSLDFVGTYSRSAYATSDLVNDYATAWSAGVQLTIPLFSGLESVWLRQSLNSQLVQLEYEAHKTADQTYLDLTTAKKNLDFAMQNVDTSREALRLAAKAFEEARRYYRLGVVIYSDFFQAEENFIDAQTAYDQSLYDCIIAIANYHVAAALPMDSLIAALNSAS